MVYGVIIALLIIIAIIITALIQEKSSEIMYELQKVEKIMSDNFEKISLSNRNMDDIYDQVKIGGLKVANICDNTLRVITESENNKEAVKSFFQTWGLDYYFDEDGYEFRVYFESKWDFPEDEMKKLYDSLPDKKDCYITCLSVEYGNLYCALWTCDENGWTYVT